MIERGLVDPGRLRELFEQVESDLFRYPAIDAAEFRAKLERTLGR
jgi:hypothetical protein